MKVLVLGSGGRESAIVWAIAKEKPTIYCAPGNPGTTPYGRNLYVKANQISSLLNFAEREGVDLTIVGPEVPLVDGVVDQFRARGFKIFGPTQMAAAIEGSKIFCKELCKKYNIPTADFEIFDDFGAAQKYIEKIGVPIVIKADGLAAGKGVIIAQTIKEAVDGLEKFMLAKIFGEAGARVVIEECMVGDECSYIVVTDGETIVPMELAKDYKRVFDGDKGPNTGGMGCYSPVESLSGAEKEFVQKNIVQPAILAMEKEGRPYSGAFYAGLMKTREGIKLLEVNCRFGDPETQVILPRLRSSAIELFEAASTGQLSKINVSWKKNCAVCVVLASDGYPGEYEKGFLISGLKDAAKHALIFHAGTEHGVGGFLTAGGRVLNVVGIGKTFYAARLKAYQAAGAVEFVGKYFRGDIAISLK